MEAIDFQKLLLEERKRNKMKRRRSRSKVKTKSSSNDKDEYSSGSPLPLDIHVDNNDSNSSNNSTKTEHVGVATPTPLSIPIIAAIPIPPWPYPRGFLSMKDVLSLQLVCDNPPSILYSKETFEEKKTIVVDHRHSIQSSRGNIADTTTAATINNNNNNNMTTADMSPSMALEQWLASIPSGDSGMGEWKTMSFGKRRVCMFGEENNEEEEIHPQQQQPQGPNSKAIAPPPRPLPPPLDELAQELVDRGVFAPETPPNHVLLNEYQPGQGIMPHTDGPVYYSRTATLSLCSSVVMEFTPRRRRQQRRRSSSQVVVEEKEEEEEVDIGKTTTASPPPPPLLQVLLEPNSLLVFQDDAYLEYCHGIPMDVWHDTTATGNCLNAPANVTISRGFRYSLTFRHKKKEATTDIETLLPRSTIDR
jgi:2OG-Fe(II) oxygenase superfamily